nr:MAG TPA: cysteine-rich protein [Caudoviricetes sp.]
MKKKKVQQKATIDPYTIKALINERLVCHLCGAEITNREKHMIPQNHTVITVCDWCWCQYLRRGRK